MALEDFIRGHVEAIESAVVRGDKAAEAAAREAYAELTGAPKKERAVKKAVPEKAVKDA